jgi:hypothetical protein
MEKKIRDEWKFEEGRHVSQVSLQVTFLCVHLLS